MVGGYNRVAPLYVIEERRARELRGVYWSPSKRCLIYVIKSAPVDMSKQWNETKSYVLLM